MRRLLLLFTTIPLLLLSTCSDEEQTSGLFTDFEEEKYIESTIGSSGGDVNYNDISVSVPAGSFNQDETIEIKSAPKDHDYEEFVNTGWYTIEGIPLDSEKPLEIKIKHNGNNSDQVYMVIGEPTLSQSLGEIDYRYRVVKAKNENGYIVYTLPLIEDAEGLIKNMPQIGLLNPEHKYSLSGIFPSILDQPAAAKEGRYKISAAGLIMGNVSYITGNEYFEVHYKNKDKIDYEAKLVGDFCEDVLFELKDYGFDFSRRTSWPVSVQIKDLSTDGSFVSTLSGHNSDYLEINKKLLSKETELKATLAHELFHLCQSLHDPKYTATRSTIMFGQKLKKIFSLGLLENSYVPPQLWLDEACSVWFEGEMLGDPNYISSVLTHQELAAFHGMQAGAGNTQGEAQKHGYGMSTMIRYITDRFGPEILPDIYNRILNGTTPPEAVELSILEKPDKWYPDYLKKLIAGELYSGIKLAKLTGLGKDVKSLTIKEFKNYKNNLTNVYPLLSGQIHRIKFNFTPEKDKIMTLELDNDDAMMFIYEFKKDGSLDFFGKFYSDTKFTLDDVIPFKETKSSLVAMIVNPYYGHPYIRTKQISANLKLEVIKNELLDFSKVNNCNVSVNYEGLVYEPVNGERWEGDGAGPRATKPNGSIKGNTYTMTWSHSSNEVVASGSIICEIDLKKKIIKRCTFSEKAEFMSEPPRSPKKSHTIYEASATVTDIPLAYSTSNLEFTFTLKGADCCKHISTVSRKVTYVYEDKYNRTLKDYRCDDDSSISIQFSIRK